MKLAAKAQNALEWFALQSGMAPEPVALTHFGYMVSKFVLEAMDKGVLEAMGKGSKTLQEIASITSLNANAVEKLLRLLASMGLVNVNNHKFSLAGKARKWLLKDSPSSLYWLLMFDHKVCYDWMQYAGTFLQTGKGLQYHDTLSSEQWFYYQKAMEAIARNAAREITRRVPTLSSPTAMLDIGGAHGLYAAAFCKKYPALQATVIDLPEAVEQAKNFEHHHLSQRIHYQAGNILHHDLSASTYDFILMASVAHHLAEKENETVAGKAYEALKPGGYFTIMEVLTPGAVQKNEDMLAAIGDLFFAFSSTSGTWSLATIKTWMTSAGFEVVKKSSFLFLPGYKAITGRKK